MKNLYQKLSEENQAKISENGLYFPTTTNLLLDVLFSEISWSRINLADALCLWFIFEPVKPFDFDEFTNFFEANNYENN